MRKLPHFNQIKDMVSLALISKGRQIQYHPDMFFFFVKWTWSTSFWLHSTVASSAAKLKKCFCSRIWQEKYYVSWSTFCHVNCVTKFQVKKSVETRNCCLQRSQLWFGKYLVSLQIDPPDILSVLQQFKVFFNKWCCMLRQLLQSMLKSLSNSDVHSFRSFRLT